MIFTQTYFEGSKRIFMKKSIQTLELEIPQNYGIIFDKLIEVLPSIGFKLTSYDKEKGYISTRVGMTILSWGADINFNIKDFHGSKTLIYIESILKSQYDFENKQKNTLKASFIDGFNGVSENQHQRYFHKIKSALSKDFNFGSKDESQSVENLSVPNGKFERLISHMAHLYKSDLSALQLFGYQALISIIIYTPYIFLFQGRKYIAVPLLSFHLLYSFCIIVGVAKATSKYNLWLTKAIVRLFFITYILADILLLSLTLAIL